MNLALVAALVIGGSMLLEMWAQVRGVGWYHRLSIPMRVGRERGMQAARCTDLPSAHVRRSGKGLSWRGKRAKTSLGLHGWASADGEHFRWAPPWTPMVACVWLALLGWVRDEFGLTLGIASMLALAMLVLYGTQATRVQREWLAAESGDRPPSHRL